MKRTGRERALGRCFRLFLWAAFQVRHGGKGVMGSGFDGSEEPRFDTTVLQVCSLKDGKDPTRHDRAMVDDGMAMIYRSVALTVSRLYRWWLYDSQF